MNLNKQKAGSHNPSLWDIISVIDRNIPDFLLLAETPSYPRNMAMSQTMRNREYNKERKKSLTKKVS